MIKLTLATPLGSIEDFVRTRLAANLALAKLRDRPLTGQAITRFGLLGDAETLDEGIFLLHRTDHSADIVVLTTPEEQPKGMTPYALALRKVDAAKSEIYVDTLAHAIKTSLIRISKRARTLRNVFGVALLCVILLIGLTVALPVFIVFVLLLPIIYPLSYFVSKRQFNRQQAAMRTLVGIFDREFSVTSRADTKDWFDFWHRVKREVEIEVATL